MFDIATTDNVKSSTTDPHRPKDFLDPSEIKSSLEAAKTGRQGVRDHLLFLMMYRHGLRCSEAIDIRREDVSFDRATLWVRRLRDVINPAVHFGISGAGSNAWYGWPNVPQLEKLVTDWVRTTDQTRRLQLADEVQKVALSEVTYVPWGEWVQPTAFRKNVRNVLKFGAPIFWNARIA
jgi:integrase